MHFCPVRQTKASNISLPFLGKPKPEVSSSLLGKPKPGSNFCSFGQTKAEIYFFALVGKPKQQVISAPLGKPKPKSFLALLGQPKQKMISPLLGKPKLKVFLCPFGQTKANIISALLGKPKPTNILPFWASPSKNAFCLFGQTKAKKMILALWARTAGRPASQIPNRVTPTPCLEPGGRFGRRRGGLTRRCSVMQTLRAPSSVPCCVRLPETKRNRHN